jgi:hypothetical protein
MRSNNVLPIVFCLLIFLVSTGLICDDLEGVTIERIDGGYPYYSSFAAAPDGSVWMVAAQARSIVAFHYSVPGLESFDVALTGGNPDVAVDTDGFVHIAYYDTKEYRLGYITNLGGGWETTFPDDTDSMGYHPAIALDDSGAVFVAYQGPDLHLRIATNRSGDWEWTVIDPTSLTGEKVSIAIDSSGKIHLCHSDGDVLYYSTDASGAWVTQQVVVFSEIISGLNSIAVGPSDEVRIAYQEDNELWYAENNSGIWTTSLLDTSTTHMIVPILHPSLKIDDLGHAHIAYAEGFLPSAWVPPDYSISYLTDASGAWVGESDFITTNVSEIELLLNPSQKPVIGYRGLDGNLHIDFAVREPSGWENTPVEEFRQLAKTATVAVGPNDQVYAVYVAVSDDAMLFARLEATGWETETIGPAVGYSEPGPSLALDSQGAAHIAFWDYDTSWDLVYATNRSGSWVRAVVDTGWDNKPGPELRIDDNDTVHIAYPTYDGNGEGLKYATNGSGAWVVEQAVPEPDVYPDFDFALGPDGRPHLSYCYQSNSGRLAHAVRDTAGWSQGFVRLTPGLCYSNSIAVDPAGSVHLIAGFEKGDVLYHSQKPGLLWKHTLIATPSNFRNTDLSIDSAGALHVVYHDWDEGSLVYLSNALGQWISALIDEGNPYAGHGEYPSMALDGRGSVHLIYRGSSALWYATFEQGFAGP